MTEVTAARLMKQRPGISRQRARVLTGACAGHVLHDGYLDLLYVLLPIWKVDFGLSYAAVGLVRATYSAVMAAAQVPVDTITRSWAPRAALVGGTLITALGFVLAGFSSSIVALCFTLAIAGLGASTQHPRGSAIVTEAFGSKSRGALGVYNFVGDVGKAIFPALTSLLLIAFNWHAVTLLLAVIGAFSAFCIWFVLPRALIAKRVEPDEKALVANPGGFVVLFLIGALDTATRMGFLLFLPFILAEHRASTATIGVGLALVFAGGAFGKFTCGWLGERLGLAGTVALTEGLTAIMMLAVPVLPLRLMLVLLPFLGVALNGTSSVLYGTVPDVTKDGNASRAFALFYTGVIGAGALSPIFYGSMADYAGRNAALLATAATALSAIPLAFVLQKRLRPSQIAFGEP